MAKHLSRRDFLKVSAGAAAAATLGTPLAAMAAPKRQDQIVIRYMPTQWSSSRDRRIERQIAFQSVIDTFNIKYPQYRVEEVIGTGDLVGSAQALDNNECDAIWVEKSWYANFQAAGKLGDLTPYGPEEDKFFPFTIETLRSVDGNLGGLWHNTDTPLFFYNTEAVPTPPKTWEEMWAMAEEYKASTGKYLTTFPFTAWLQMWGGDFEALGGRWLDDEGVPALFEHKDLLIRMMQPWVDAVQNDLIPSEAVLNDHNSQMPLMYAGDAVSFGGNSNMHIRALAPNLPPEEYELWTATSLPVPEELDAHAATAGGWVIALVKNDDPAIQEAAATWVLHATGMAAIRDTTKAGGWVPTRPEVLEADPYYADDTIMAATVEALNTNGYVPPFFPAYTILGPALRDLALTPAATGQTTLEEGLVAAEEQINREYTELYAE